MGGTGQEGGAGRGEGDEGDRAVAMAVVMAAAVPGTVAGVGDLDVAVDVAVAVVAVVPGAVEEAVAVALAFVAAVALAVVMALDLAVAVVEDVEVVVSGAVGASVADGCRGATGEERRVGGPVDHRIPPLQSLCCGCDMRRNTATAISGTSRQSDGRFPATVAAMSAVRQILSRRRRAGRGGRRNGRGLPATCA